MTNDFDEIKDAEKQINWEIEQMDKFNDYLDMIMDTPEDEKKFKVLEGLSGIITQNNEEIFYHTVFACKHGIYTPVVLTSEGKLYSVKYLPKLIISDGSDYCIYDEDAEPKYKKVKEVPEEYRYYFFIRKGITYKYPLKVFFDDSQGIKTISNDAIHDIVNNRKYTKKIYDEAIDIIKEYFFHTYSFEYDVINTTSIQSYIQWILGRVYYLGLYGGKGTGKTTGSILLSFLQFNGYFTGKGTLANSCRLLNFQGIALNQDEFEKMKSDEKIQYVNIFNTGLIRYGRYSLANTSIKDITRQSTGLRTFGVKSFTVNDFSGFDPSFLDRLYVILSQKNNKHLKDIRCLNEKELNKFQKIRDKIFVYCMLNWKQIIESINNTQEELEKKGIFGRETDKNSIILGIINHFKGSEYSNKVKQYIIEKAPLMQMEYVQTMEDIILNTILEKYIEKQSSMIDIDNEELYIRLLNDLGMDKKDKYAPSDQKPRKILDHLGLTLKAENLGYNSRGARRFHINSKQFIHKLDEPEYKKIKEKIPIDLLLSPTKPTKPVSKNTEGFGKSDNAEEYKPRDIFNVMLNHPAREWHHTEIAEEMNLSISKGKKLFYYLKDLTSNPKNNTPIRRGKEEGYYHIISNNWVGE